MSRWGEMQYLIFGFLGLLAVTPCLAILWRGTNLRARLWRLGCWRWVICCDRFCGESVTQADIMQRTGAQTLQAHYEMMFSSHERPSLALRLANWRRDVQTGVNRDLRTLKLEEIQIKSESMERYEPPQVPVPANASLSAAEIAAKLQSRAASSDRQRLPLAALNAKRQEEQEETKVDDVV